MHVLCGVGMVAKLCMAYYSGKGTNLYIKVCMVCEVCLFSWMGVRPIYIDLNMYMGSRVCRVCMSPHGLPGFENRIIPQNTYICTQFYWGYSGSRVCRVCIPANPYK